MKQHENMEDLLDEAIEAVRDERPEAELETAAVDRVRKLLESGAAYDDGTLGEASPAEQVLVTSPVDDFAARIPAYLDGELSENQRLMFEEEARSSVTLRRQLSAAREARAAEAMAESGPVEVEEAGSRRGWLAAAVVLLAGALSVFAFAPDLVPMPQAEVASVVTVDGNLFEVENDELVPVPVGTLLDGKRQFRTAKGSRAVLELRDGSRVEVDERSEVRVFRRLGGDRVVVDRGQVIVRAAKQKRGTLKVQTQELTATVKGTIFGVSHGTKGSRVSVIEGEVEVLSGSASQSLLPGGQLASRAALAHVPLEEEVAWSRDADEYIAMLRELSSLQQEFAQAMASAPRYSTRLLDLAPADATVYIAVPNATAKISDAYVAVTEKLTESEQLGAMWQEFSASEDRAELDDFMGWLGDVSDQLGEETVVAVGTGHALTDSDGWFLLTSEVYDRTALRVILEEKVDELLAEARAAGEDIDGDEVVFLDDPAAAQPDQLSIWISDDLLVISSEPRVLQQVTAFADGTTNPFVGTAFYDRLAASYVEGAQFLAAVDLERLMAAVQTAEDFDSEALEMVGLDNVRHLIVERRADGQRAQLSASLSFDGDRHGVMSWLAEPGPMGALDFFSADTTVVAATVVRDPAELFAEMLGFATARATGTDEDGDGEAVSHGLADFEAKTGVRLVDDLLAPLGGEMAVGLDGPALPQPSWKAVVEVYDEATLQASLETMVARLAEHIAAEASDASIGISETNVSGRTFYRLWGESGSEESEDGILDPMSGLELTMSEIHYTFVDGYMVAAASRPLLERAIQVRDSGASLVESAAFRELLPPDGYLDFSALVWNRLGELMGEFAGKLPQTDLLDEAQVQALEELKAASGPALYCAYGDRDAIRLVSHGAQALPLGGLSGVFGLGSMVDGITSATPIAQAVAGTRIVGVDPHAPSDDEGDAWQ